jgi:hypothetical protein
VPAGIPFVEGISSQISTTNGDAFFPNSSGGYVSLPFAPGPPILLANTPAVAVGSIATAYGADLATGVAAGNTTLTLKTPREHRRHARCSMCLPSR